MSECVSTSTAQALYYRIPVLHPLSWGVALYYRIRRPWRVQHAVLHPLSYTPQLHPLSYTPLPVGLGECGAQCILPARMLVQEGFVILLLRRRPAADMRHALHNAQCTMHNAHAVCVRCACGGHAAHLGQEVQSACTLSSSPSTASCTCEAAQEAAQGSESVRPLAEPRCARARACASASSSSLSRGEG